MASKSPPASFIVEIITSQNVLGSYLTFSSLFLVLYLVPCEKYHISRIHEDEESLLEELDVVL